MVPSDDPSSYTTSSHAASVWARTLSSVAPRKCSRLKAGTTIEMRGLAPPSSGRSVEVTRAYGTGLPAITIRLMFDTTVLPGYVIWITFEPPLLTSARLIGTAIDRHMVFLPSLNGHAGEIH